MAIEHGLIQALTQLKVNAPPATRDPALPTTAAPAPPAPAAVDVLDTLVKRITDAITPVQAAAGKAQVAKRCFACGRYGHYAAKCPTKSGKGKAGKGAGKADAQAYNWKSNGKGYDQQAGPRYSPYGRPVRFTFEC